jgi:hypothetical protein
METKIITYKFKNGVEIKGTFDKLLLTAELFKETLDFSKTGLDFIPQGYYPSETKGVIPIADMGEYHLRRALIKRSKDYLLSIFDSVDSNKVFLRKYLNMANDRIVTDLYAELQKRG